MPDRTEPFPWPDGRRAACSLSFDDARLSQIDHAIPVLDRHGFRATFYVSLRLAEKRPDEWTQAAQSGHEIGGHSLRHACSGNFTFAHGNALEDYTLERMEEELVESNRLIEDMLGVAPRTFAYPCGQTFVGRGIDSRSYVPVVAKHYLAGRCYYNESCNAPDFCDLARLFAYKFDTQPLEELTGLIDRAVEQGAWIVFAGHEVGTQGGQNIDVEKFEAVLRYLRANEETVWTDTVLNIAQTIDAHREL